MLHEAAVQWKVEAEAVNVCLSQLNDSATSQLHIQETFRHTPRELTQARTGKSKREKIRAEHVALTSTFLWT